MTPTEEGTEKEKYQRQYIRLLETENQYLVRTLNGLNTPLPYSVSTDLLNRKYGHSSSPWQDEEESYRNEIEVLKKELEFRLEELQDKEVGLHKLHEYCKAGEYGYSESMMHDCIQLTLSKWEAQKTNPLKK